MISIHLTDHMTGENLHIEFDLEADRITINGVEVNRKRPLEQGEQVHYGQKGVPGPWKLYTLTNDHLAAMRELWRRYKEGGPPGASSK